MTHSLPHPPHPRYSSTRQLTWQRRYNTQPRILSSAQERMTRTIMAAVRDLRGEAQYWARLCLSMVGRGGDGQRIRDEILNIMHRHHIKEVKGTWMEEWHQKLHNNTTPDDIPICEAYIAFLKGNGDIGAYWRVRGDVGGGGLLCWAIGGAVCVCVGGKGGCCTWQGHGPH